ncbi:MAG: polysaccharide biosynthesis tyrosine autokinase [Clostridiales bacterium]|nr:polysaccharide biosynthesis tyrosine autokinase [Clostridiales bacterium]
MSNNENKNIQGGIEINVAYLTKILLSKWWVILLAAVFAACCGFAAGELTKTPTYSSSISFVVSNRTISSEESYSSSDINASITMANTYKYILSSRTLYEKVAKSANVSTGLLSKAITITSIPNTNIIVMRITTESGNLSYDIAVAVIDNFNDVVQKTGYINSTLSVCELPNIPGGPDANTSGIRFAIIGAFAGTVLAIVIIMLSNVMKDTIHSADEIQSRLDLKILGVVARVNLRKKDKGDTPLLIDERLTGFGFIETYKALRTKIENIYAKHGHKVFVVSSTGENEGKTTVACNIAISLAQNGRSVLLIDADLRKPTVCRMLSLTKSKENKGHGLPDVINDLSTFERAIRYVERHKIFILAGTSVVSDPAELLSTSQMEKVVKAVKNEFDFVIIDTAPAGVVTDASIITNYADALLMVVREDQTPVNKIKMTLADLSNGRAEIVGCIYNNVTTGFGTHLYSRYGRYGYRRYGYRYGGYGGYGSYGYGYGYGYGGYPSDDYDDTAENDPDD